MQAVTCSHLVPSHTRAGWLAVMLTVLWALALEAHRVEANPPVIESTGFESLDWDPAPGFFCGAAYFGTCVAAPIPNSCTGNPVTDVNCCIGSPNVLNSWYASASSQHCREPHIDNQNPASDSQHLRFVRDPNGGNQPGCIGLGAACRQSAFTPSLPRQPVGPTRIDFDIAGSNVAGGSLRWFAVADADPALISARLLFSEDGTIYATDNAIGEDVAAGSWVPGPAYKRVTVELNPCTDSLKYSYDGSLIYSTTLTNSARTVQRSIFEHDNGGQTNEFWDIDNYSVVRGPECPHVCGDNSLDISGVEECDGTEEAACPGDCRSPGHVLGGCKCQRGACCLGGTVCTNETTPAACQDPPPDGLGGTFLGDGKKCATQNAGFFQEGSGNVFVHVVGPPTTCDTLPGLSRGPCSPNGPYIDAWVSTQDGSMCHNFGAAETTPIPAGFFGLDSDAFAGVVCLRGESLQQPEFGDADTLIERSADPFDRCSLPSPTAATVDIQIIELNLVSTSPITVTYNGGATSDQWDVSVDLSPAGPIPGTPPSTLTALKTHCNGGTYTSVLYVQPRFTFTKVGDPGAPAVVLDTGQPDTQAPAVELEQTDPHPWVSDIDPFLAAVDPCSHFHANIDEPNPQLICDCNETGTIDKCDIEQTLSADCNANARPDECDIIAGAADCNTNQVPDACDVTLTDCNANLLPDDCDVADCGSDPACADCNSNEVPDGCDAAATGMDLNSNDVPDDCEAPPALATVPGGVGMNRFIAVVVPSSGAGQDTALRVALTTLDHPRLCCTNSNGTPCSATTCDVDSDCAGVPNGNQTCAHQAAGSPNYSAFEGGIRYVNSFSFPAPDGSLDCPDDGPPSNSSYKCATLGCEPEYRDWATDLASPGPGQPPVPGLLYITGDAIVPSSTLEISHVAAFCGAASAANTCAAASAPLASGTARWGDLNGAGFSPPDGKSDVLDIPPIVNKLKTVSPIFPEPRLWLKQRDPRPDTDAITVIDLSDAVDAGPQAKPYPASRTIDACAHD